MADTILVPATLPMTPWEYIKRRRLLAGLSIEQAAAPFWKRPEHRADCEANTRMLERKGIVAKPWHAREYLRAVPFDVDVYFQLADLPMFHPTLCRCCGSTEMEPRETRDGASARLIADGICTACHEDIAEAQQHRKAA